LCYFALNRRKLKKFLTNVIGEFTGSWQHAIDSQQVTC
jgi:hypothetical protein